MMKRLALTLTLVVVAGCGPVVKTADCIAVKGPCTAKFRMSLLREWHNGTAEVQAVYNGPPGTTMAVRVDGHPTVGPYVPGGVFSLSEYEVYGFGRPLSAHFRFYDAGGGLMGGFDLPFSVPMQGIIAYPVIASPP